MRRTPPAIHPESAASVAAAAADRTINPDLERWYAEAISGLVDGLSVDGKLLVPAAPADPPAVNVMPLRAGRRSVAGWYSGTAKDSQDTLEFSAMTGMHPMIEKYPLSRVAEAYEQMHRAKCASASS